MSPGALSFAKLVMMSSAPVKSAEDVRYASQDPFSQSTLSHDNLDCRGSKSRISLHGNIQHNNKIIDHCTTKFMRNTDEPCKKSLTERWPYSACRLAVFLWASPDIRRVLSGFTFQLPPVQLFLPASKNSLYHVISILKPQSKINGSPGKVLKPFQ